VWAGVMDLTTMKIRNEIVLFLLAAYAALAPLTGLGLEQMGMNALVALGMLGCMFVFFGLGWMGGGDAKLATAVTLWLGADHALSYVLYTALFGGVLTLGILQFRSMPLPAAYLRKPWVSRLHAAETGIPYGVAIAGAALFIFPQTPWIIPLF
jgi:prepilin peptidase CpaA